MAPQNYNNHIRYYTPHHFLFYPVVILLVLLSAYGWFRHPEDSLLWILMIASIVLIGVLSFMLRQHYSLINQNRTVRLEVRFRYYVLTQRRFEPLEAQLSLGQVFALRFASDEELPALADRAIAEKLSPDAIKRAIRNWLPDTMRV